MFRFRVKRDRGKWHVWVEGPLDRRLCSREHVDTHGRRDAYQEWQGQVQALNLKMALVRLQHLIPELQED